jgi:ABC-type transport system involved in multi-copper enzyme maturation permease subunit
MSAPGLLSRLDDWVNPIVVRELRQAVKSRLVTGALLLFVSLQVLILGIFLVARELSDTPGAVDFRAGAHMFVVLQGILLGTCMVLVPGVAGARLGAERSDSNVDLMFISSLTPRAIVWGKFLSAIILALLIFSACAPFMTFTYLLRGIDIPTILVVLGVDFLVVVGGTQVAIFLACVPVNRALKALLGVGGFVALMQAYVGTVMATVGMVEAGLNVFLDSWEFWGPALALTAGYLGVVGLVFVWSVAVVSPPSANRALPVRLYVLGLWLATGPIAAAWAREIDHCGPVLTWVLLAVLLFCLQFAVSINEREAWGPRIARTVPRNPLLRAGAFLLYSGSAGGVLFSAAGAGLTLLAGEAWVRHYPAMRAAGDWQSWARMVGAVALYAACYGLTAVALRHYLAGGRVRPTFTWVLAMVLVGVCSAGPALAAYFLYYREWGAHAQERWWVLPNPFASLIEMTELRRRVAPSGGEYPRQVLAFTGTWAAAAALMCLPWFVRQARRFRPTARGAAVAAAVDNHRQERGHEAVFGRG